MPNDRAVVAAVEHALAHPPPYNRAGGATAHRAQHLHQPTARLELLTDEQRDLRHDGLIHADRSPTNPTLHPDVAYSLHF